MAWFQKIVCCFTFLLVICIAAEREHGVFLAHSCARILPVPAKKWPVIMLHGLGGSKEGWRGIYEPLIHLTGRRVCIYDARNHGDSGWNDTFNVDVLAEDLGNFMTDVKIERASLVGHSMGGLTAMKFALKNPERVESMFVEDIAPSSVTPEVSVTLMKFFKILLDCLSSVPADADEESAKKAVLDCITKMADFQISEDIEKLLSLRRRDGVWKWKANFEVFIEALEKEGYFTGKMEGRYEGRAFFIYGTASPYKVNEHEEEIRKLFPKSEFFGVEGAAHIVHANHTIYMRKLVEFLNRKDS